MHLSASTGTEFSAPINPACTLQTMCTTYTCTD